MLLSHKWSFICANVFSFNRGVLFKDTKDCLSWILPDQLCLNSCSKYQISYYYFNNFVGLLLKELKYMCNILVSKTLHKLTNFFIKCIVLVISNFFCYAVTKNVQAFINRTDFFTNLLYLKIHSTVSKNSYSILFMEIMRTKYIFFNSQKLILAKSNGLEVLIIR